MRWMITDSGLGGLSVCAGLEQALTQQDRGQGIELLYVNATPDDRSGYNALATQSQRIALFNQFLQAASNRYAPHEIAIACNTLSVIYPETEFASQTKIDVKGIVGAGVELINTNMDQYPHHKLIVFATETTTEADTYPRLVKAKAAEISPQECPELAHAISNDASGQACKSLLSGYVDEALQRFEQLPQDVFAFLGCTHYGYQANIFETLLNERGCNCKILNPNDLLVEQLIPESKPEVSAGQAPLRVRFVTRYTIPEVEIASMEAYLKDTAPLTLAALHDQIVVPDLFEIDQLPK